MIGSDQSATNRTVESFCVSIITSFIKDKIDVKLSTIYLPYLLGFWNEKSPERLQHSGLCFC